MDLDEQIGPTRPQCKKKVDIPPEGQAHQPVRATITKCPRLGLPAQTMTLHLRRLGSEVDSVGAQASSPCVLTCSSLCVCLCPVSFSYKDTRQTGLGPLWDLILTL
jgi:hypothetical protein